MTQFQNETANSYKNAIEQKELDKETKKLIMRENGEQRLRDLEEERLKLFNKMASKREEQARYRDVLDIQVTSLK